MSVTSLPRQSTSFALPVAQYQQASVSSMAVLFTTELHIDRIAWQLWLAGHNVDQAYTKVLHRNKQNNPNYVPQNSAAVVKSYLLSQYRNFELLEKYLHRPKLLGSQLIYPLDMETRKYLIDSYYRFEPRVLRELLGKKLSSRATRKELEDAHVRTQIPLAGCRRMFDNLKRIMKRIEDQNGNIFKLVQDDFLLEDELAGQYSHIIFINFYRLDTTKKKLAHLTFNDFDYLGSIIMQYFTIVSEAAIDDFDMGLAQDARDLKTILVNHNKTLDEFRARVMTYLQQLQTVTATASSSTTSPPGSPPPTTAILQTVLERCSPNAFKTILKNMFGVGAGLSYNKELRDVFATLVEKIVEPCAACGWGRAEVDAFFTSLIACFEKVELLALHHRKRYKTSFTKLCMAVKLSAERLMRQ